MDFAGLRALDSVDLRLSRGEIVGLIGPNGAGKTTLVNVLSGFQRADLGSVVIDGADVTRRAPGRRARLGLSRTFQNVRLFASLTASQNVEAAALGVGMTPRAARARTRLLLERFGLADRAQRVAGTLPYADERRLGLARALAGAPVYLLLDEPAAGLDEHEGDELSKILATLPEQDGCGVLLIEHDMRLVMRLCHRIQVIDHGQTIAVGTPDNVRSDPAVLEAYLGTGHQVHPHA